MDNLPDPYPHAGLTRIHAQVTHIVVDEVHERSLDSDLLLLMLCDVLRVHPRLRVVLMSATADAQLFAGYFDSALRGRVRARAGEPRNFCCIVTIPGFTYPVRVLTLEDALEATGATLFVFLFFFFFLLSPPTVPRGSYR